MKLSLQKAPLIKRYKRFLADIELTTNLSSHTTIHVANTGAMTGCADIGDDVWYSTSNNEKRKYPHSWELTQKNNGDLICVNTIRANQLTEEALLAGTISQCVNFSHLQREVKYGDEKSKIDFYLLDENQTPTYIEVKSVTLLSKDPLSNMSQGYFPDTVTTRGQKHLRELITMKAQGNRAILLFAVLHSGINSVKAAAHIDNKYAETLAQAIAAGVEVIAYKASYTVHNKLFNITLSDEIPFI